MANRSLAGRQPLSPGTGGSFLPFQGSGTSDGKNSGLSPPVESPPVDTFARLCWSKDPRPRGPMTMSATLCDIGRATVSIFLIGDGHSRGEKEGWTLRVLIGPAQSGEKTSSVPQHLVTLPVE